MSTLGERLTAFREAKGLSRARLAADADVSYSLVNQVERDLRDPSASNLANIARALGVTVDALLSDEPENDLDDGRRLPPPAAKARVEIQEILDRLSPDDLMSARDLLSAWASRPADTGMGRPV